VANGLSEEKRHEGDMNDQRKRLVEGARQAQPQAKSRASRRPWSRRSPAFFDPLRRLFEHPERLVQPYVKEGHVVADLGCGSGYYALTLADLVGPTGKVYAVDLDEKAIRALSKRAEKAGYRNIEARAVSAVDVSFIEDKSVDFVLANGLLCSMSTNRQSAVNEMKRILKPTGKAYISLGFGPPLGFVNEAEWQKTLEGFRVEQGGTYKEKWAVVYLREG
jgi:ubiquinone/menaquinone biosynthesis C-methylase UbiE